MAVNGFPMSPNGYPPTPMNGGYPRTPVNANGLAPAQVPLPSTPLPPGTPSRPNLTSPFGQNGLSISPSPSTPQRSPSAYSPSSPLSPYAQPSGNGSAPRISLSPRVDKRLD
ncbi:hypothetical protein FRB90_006076 [Tulasnella sp. 427]|nr:hypothetical protein FRB90_006076 [Tulasnella sp. 427]